MGEMGTSEQMVRYDICAGPDGRYWEPEPHPTGAYVLHTDATREIERMRVWLQKIVAIDPYLPEAEQYTPATQMAQWARCALAGQEPPPANIVREPGYVDPDF
jgi:hypothetical protein